MWRTTTIEGTDEFGAAHQSEITLEKDLNSLTAGAAGFSIEDGKTIMAHLQQVIVKQQCETYVSVRRFCVDCERFPGKPLRSQLRDASADYAAPVPVTIS